MFVNWWVVLRVVALRAPEIAVPNYFLIRVKIRIQVPIPGLNDATQIDNHELGVCRNASRRKAGEHQFFTRIREAALVLLFE